MNSVIYATGVMGFACMFFGFFNLAGVIYSIGILAMLHEIFRGKWL